ncbi:hypothetical protein GUY44_15305 [Pimelobacter simplex]|nr:group I intron-associated PD-(D/E)XK endonuclease [Pimelobacter simplex]MCG8151855.1 hypothetical protein [Pimelobacter simplex]GEB12611.1 hypothetical protein NSI01_09260 [Pimelobacter simplex]SFM56945.1 hypothetical protein SAMN05421671_2421 [Pimelobacter simplex]
MRAHHTKSKGDLGVAKAYADLVAQGHVVLFPSTEHAPFDLVAYKHGRFLRIQVKYRAASASGAVEVEFKSVWSDRHGHHVRQLDKSEVDVFCVYCPDTDECYYFRPREHGRSLTLRVRPTRNNQRTGVWPAADFREVPAPLPEYPYGV